MGNNIATTQFDDLTINFTLFKVRQLKYFNTHTVIINLV